MAGEGCHTRRGSNNLTRASQTFHQRRATSQPLKRSAGENPKKILPFFRSQLPAAFVREKKKKKTPQTKPVHVKLEADEDFRVVSRTSGEEKFFYERTRRGVLENRKRSSVSVCPGLQCFSASFISWQIGGGKRALKRFDNREVIRFFFPSLSVAHTDPTRLRVAADTNQRGCAVRSNRAMHPGDKIIMSSGSVSASVLDAQTAFSRSTCGRERRCCDRAARFPIIWFP